MCRLRLQTQHRECVPTNFAVGDANFRCRSLAHIVGKAGEERERERERERDTLIEIHDKINE